MSVKSQKLHDLVSEVSAGYKPLREVKELSSLLDSSINFDTMSENSDEDLSGSSSLQHVLTRLGIQANQLDLSASVVEQREKVQFYEL